MTRVNVLNLIKDYIKNSGPPKEYVERIVPTLDEGDWEYHIHTAWVEGFLCGLVKMEGWGISMEEYEEIMTWVTTELPKIFPTKEVK